MVLPEEPPWGSPLAPLNGHICRPWWQELRRRRRRRQAPCHPRGHARHSADAGKAVASRVTSSKTARISLWKTVNTAASKDIKRRKGSLLLRSERYCPNHERVIDYICSDMIVKFPRHGGDISIVPVVPRKAVAEVSKIGKLQERLAVVNHGWQSEPIDGTKAGWSYVFWNGCNGCSGHLVGHLTHNCWM